jgi:hypothetical protein
MKKTFLPMIFCLFALTGAYSQQYNVEWGELGKGKGRAFDILPLGGKDFFTLHSTGSAMFPTYRVAEHKNFEMTKTGRIIMKANGSAAAYEGSKVIGGKFVVFLSDRKGNENTFFMQEYNKDLEPKGNAIELAKYQFEKGQSRGSFSIISSQDAAFFAVIWTIPGKKEKADTYGFKVFDSELTEASEGEYELPYDGNLSNINQHYLSNSGDYFLSVNEYKASDKKRLFRNFADYKAMHILHITPDNVEEYTLDLAGKRVETVLMNSDNSGVFSLVGLYGKKEAAGVAGIFNIKLDFFKNKVLDEGFEEFTKDFITQDWSDRQKEKADKREAKGKGEPQLYNYLMRQTEVLADGSVVGSIEQYYVVVHAYTDSKGITHTTYTYYYNDIIAFKIGLGGDFDWVQKINKYQVSTNDGGPLSSYCRFVDGDKIAFIFNDNVQNYDEKGKFVVKEKGRIYAANYSKKKNVVVLVTLDTKDGEINRETFFDRKELEAMAVPKMFNVDYTNGEVLLYAIMRSKERFGIINLDNKR